MNRDIYVKASCKNINQHFNFIYKGIYTKQKSVYVTRKK